MEKIENKEGKRGEVKDKSEGKRRGRGTQKIQDGEQRKERCWRFYGAKKIKEMEDEKGKERVNEKKNKEEENRCEKKVKLNKSGLMKESRDETKGRKKRKIKEIERKEKDKGEIHRQNDRKRKGMTER